MKNMLTCLKCFFFNFVKDNRSHIRVSYVYYFVDANHMSWILCFLCSCMLFDVKLVFFLNVNEYCCFTLLDTLLDTAVVRLFAFSTTGDDKMSLVAPTYPHVVLCKIDGAIRIHHQVDCPCYFVACCLMW